MIRFITRVVWIWLCITLFVSANARSVKTAKVVVSQIVEHPDLLRVGDWLMSSKRKVTLKEKTWILSSNCRRKPVIAVQIAREYVGEKPDVLVGIAGPRLKL